MTGFGALLSMLVLFGAPPAVACQCLPGGVDWTSPVDGQQGVPRNVQLRRWGELTEPLPLDVFVDGVQVETRDRYQQFGPHTLTVTTPTLLLPAEVEVEARLSGTDVVAMRFTTGAEEDTTPPTWNGELLVEDLTQDIGTCGKLHGLRFTLEDLEDDHWGLDGLLVVAEPVRVGEPAAGQGDLLEIVSWMCVDEDPTLSRSAKRSYRIHVVDGSGNATRVFETEASGCGCQVADQNRWTLWSGLLVVLSLRRQRRTSVAFGERPRAQR